MIGTRFSIRVGNCHSNRICAFGKITVSIFRNSISIFYRHAVAVRSIGFRFYRYSTADCICLIFCNIRLKSQIQRTTFCIFQRNVCGRDTFKRHLVFLHLHTTCAGRVFHRITCFHLKFSTSHSFFYTGSAIVLFTFPRNGFSLCGWLRILRIFLYFPPGKDC